MKMGISPAELGTHSIRKGVATDVGANPGIVDDKAVHRRGGWSQGLIVDTYHCYGDGSQDRVVGRLSAGLLPNDRDTFLSLPPHFRKEDVILSERQWNQVLPSYSSFPVNFKAVLPYLLASVVFHRDWLNRTLHANHPFRMSLLMTSGLIDKLNLGSKVHTGVDRNADTCMKATGIPTVLTLLHPNSLGRESAPFGDEQYEREREQILRELHEQRQHSCRIEGLLNELIELIRSPGVQGAQTTCSLPPLANMEDTAMDTEVLPSSPNSPVRVATHPFLWRRNDTLQEEYHAVPKEHPIPYCVVSAAWSLWYGGDKSDPDVQIPPFRHIVSELDLVTKKQRNIYCKMSCIIREISSHCGELDVAVMTRMEMDAVFRQEMFERGYEPLFNKLYPHRTVEDKAVTTIYKDLKALEKLEKEGVANAAHAGLDT
jgi:hypothetical protein